MNNEDFIRHEIWPPSLLRVDERVETPEAELKRLKDAWSREEDDIQQTLGKALGYPWFKDDQKNFPGSTEEHGVCVGEHVAATLADEAANKIRTLKETVAMLESMLPDE